MNVLSNFYVREIVNKLNTNNIINLTMQTAVSHQTNNVMISLIIIHICDTSLVPGIQI